MVQKSLAPENAASLGRPFSGTVAVLPRHGTFVTIGKPGLLIMMLLTKVHTFFSS